MKIAAELESALAFDEPGQISFEEMNATQLIDDILVPDHDVMKQVMPVIHSHLERVANKHGNYFPYMKRVFELFTSVQKDMTKHMEKEERDLFPGIKETEKPGYEIRPIISSPDYLRALQTEHEQVGTMMFSIRDLTNNYTAPEEACTTFRLSLAELKEFENNLHKHIHIENNILLPKAEKIVDEPKSCCPSTRQ
jgi:regulator of cell morphogenesis and NO signaling